MKTEKEVRYHCLEAECVSRAAIVGEGEQVVLDFEGGLESGQGD